MARSVLKPAVFGVFALLAVDSWAAEPTPKVNLVGRPAPEIDSLPGGPYRALVVQGHALSTRTPATKPP